MTQRTPRQIRALELVLFQIEKLSILDNQISLDPTQERASNREAVVQVLNEAIQSLPKSDQTPSFLLALYNKRQTIFQSYLIDPHVIVETFFESLNPNQRDVVLSDIEQITFYKNAIDFYKTTPDGTLLPNIESMSLARLLDPNEITTLDVLKNRIYTPLTLGDEQIPLASIVARFQNGDLVFLEKTSDLAPSLIEGLQDVIHPATVYYGNGDKATNVAVSLYDGSIVVNARLKDGSFDLDSMYNQNIDYGYGGQDSPLDLAFDKSRPYTFTSNVGSTFIRQPGQAEIPNKDHLIKKLAQDFDCSSLILDTLKVIIDEIFSESEYTKSFYEIALNIPSVLRVFNIMGFPLYSAQTLSDTFVFAYSNDYALAQSFYDFVDNKLKATVASDFTTKCIQVLSALKVATSNIDRNKFESSMGEDLEVEFYNNLFRNDSFSEFRNESFALQLTPTDVEAVLAGESYTPPTQVPTPNLTVESTLDILNDKTVLKTWLEQEQLKLEYAQERTKSQAKAVFVLTAFAVASYLGYRKQKEVSKLLAI